MAFGRCAERLLAPLSGRLASRDLHDIRQEGTDLFQMIDMQKILGLNPRIQHQGMDPEVWPISGFRLLVGSSCRWKPARSSLARGRWPTLCSAGDPNLSHHAGMATMKAAPLIASTTGQGPGRQQDGGPPHQPLHGGFGICGRVLKRCLLNRTPEPHDRQLATTALGGARQNARCTQLPVQVPQGFPGRLSTLSRPARSQMHCPVASVPG